MSVYFTQTSKIVLPKSATSFYLAELGAIVTTGNTTGTSVAGQADALMELVNWSNETAFGVYFKGDDDIEADGGHARARSVERYPETAKATYELLEDDSRAILLGSWLNDKFRAHTDIQRPLTSSAARRKCTRWPKPCSARRSTVPCDEDGVRRT